MSRVFFAFKPPGFSPDGERAVEVARPWDSKGKCIAETYETQPPPRRQSNAGTSQPARTGTTPVSRPKVSSNFGRARELVRPATTTSPDLPTAARKSRGGSITPVD